MKSSVEPLEGNKVKLSVEVDEEELDRACAQAARKLASQVRLPGFRPGKAPRKVLEAKLGTAAVREEALRESIGEWYARALRDTEVDAIAAPQIDITDGAEQGPLLFDAVVEVRPRITVPGYAGLRVEVPAIEVEESDVDRQIDRLRDTFAELRYVDRAAADGDHVRIDLKGERDGEVVPGSEATDYSYEVGSASIAEELDEALRGAKAGDIVAFSMEAGDAGPISFTALVKAVQEKVLPELTDEWAGEASEFETVEELRADVRKRLGVVRKVQANLAIRDEAVKALVELVEDEAPAPLVDGELQHRLQDLVQRLQAQGATVEQYLAATGQSGEALLADLREGAVAAVKADLALRAVAEAEGIEATEDDLDAEVARLADQLELSEREVRSRLERGDQVEAVRSDVRRGKALAWLLEHVEVVDDQGRPIDRADLQPETEAHADDPSAGEETEA